MSLDDARQLAASRRGNAPAMALLLAVSGWGSVTIERGHRARGGGAGRRRMAGRGGDGQNAARGRLAPGAAVRRRAADPEGSGGFWERVPVTADRRMTLTAAAACAATSLALYPLFIDWRWFVVAVGAVIAAAAAGSATRLRALPWPACLAGGLAGLLLYLNVVFEASHSLLLFIPTHASLVRLWVLAGTGVGDAYTRTHPAPDLPGLLLLSTAGVGITAVLTDLIAVRLRSAALAGLPLLLLFTAPGPDERALRPAGNRAGVLPRRGRVPGPAGRGRPGKDQGLGAPDLIAAHPAVAPSRSRAAGRARLSRAGLRRTGVGRPAAGGWPALGQPVLLGSRRPVVTRRYRAGLRTAERQPSERGIHVHDHRIGESGE